MSVIALRLAGPLQSWGSRSKFQRRLTDSAPTKSGVLGLIAAAKGIPRTGRLDELRDLRFGVRIDQPGEILRDFHIARRPETGRSGSTTWTTLPVSERYYMADAVYLAALEGPPDVIGDIAAAIRSPQIPIYLGRRSCPPEWPITLGSHDADLTTILADTTWLASQQHQQRHHRATVQLTTIRDAERTATGLERALDVPLSFDPNHRRYTWRQTVRGRVEIPNPQHARSHSPEESEIAPCS